MIRARVLKIWYNYGTLELAEYFMWIPAEKPMLRELKSARVTADCLNKFKLIIPILDPPRFLSILLIKKSIAKITIDINNIMLKLFRNSEYIFIPHTLEGT